MTVDEADLLVDQLVGADLKLLMSARCVGTVGLWQRPQQRLRRFGKLAPGLVDRLAVFAMHTQPYQIAAQ